MKRIMAWVLTAALCLGLIPLLATDTEAAESDGTRIVSISAGTTMSAAVREDGTLWTWGCDGLTRTYAAWYASSKDIRAQSLGLAAGQYVFGTPMMVFSESANSVSCSMYPADTNFGARSDDFLCAPITAVLQNDSSLWMWGGNGNGALGNGSTDYSWQPFKVLENVVSYDVSGNHSAAVTEDGSLYMWGENAYGQLGDGTTEAKTSPVKIMDGVAAVSLGEYFSAALKEDGTLWTWGRNDYGQLGNGTTEDSLVPSQVLSGVRALAVGSYHAAAVKVDGSLWVWGRNNYGQLGLGNKTDIKAPTKNGDVENASAVSLGEYNSAAIDADGALFMWGCNDFGQLGDESETSRSRPVLVLESVQQVALGPGHTLALKWDGTVWSWGSNYSGQLGVPSVSSRSNYPRQVQLGQVGVSFAGDGTTEKTLTIPWDDSWFYSYPGIYNEDLAIGGIVLSEAAYGSTGMFSQLGYAYADSNSSAGPSKPAYYVGYKATYDFDDPHVYIAMAVKGTSDDGDTMTNIRSITDNFDGAGQYCLDALNQAEESIISKLSSAGLEISLTKSNTKYFISGHSLGGACAGKLGLLLAKKRLVNLNNLYVYTYATPRFNTDPLQNSAVPGLFNIINADDTVVPNVPPFMYNGIIPIPAFRAGTDKYYIGSDANTLFRTSLYNIYGYLPDNRYSGIPWIEHCAHMTPYYLSMLLAKGTQSDINRVFSRARLISAHCPVELEVYDPAGSLCAYTKDGEAYYPGNTTVRIVIIGDEKFAELPDGEYSIRYVGTDDGTMMLEDQIFDLETGEVTSEQIFENIVLEEGKTFASTADAAADTVETKLFVLDDEGDRISSVSESGEETTLAKYDITEWDFSLVGDSSFIYDGEEKRPEVSVPADLVEGSDYRLIYENNIAAGHASVTVKGLNEYAGRVVLPFDITAEGVCGEGLSWTLDADGGLTVRGEGFLNETDGGDWWYANRDAISSVRVESGITGISIGAFRDHAALASVVLPESLTWIGEEAFAGCETLEDVYYDGLQAQWETVEIGDGNEALLNASLHFALPELTHIDGVDASCTEDGYEEYWKDEKTGKLYTDANAETELDAPVVVPAKGHDMIRTEAIEATAEAEGNIEFWTCLQCGKHFSDENGKTEISATDTVIAKLTPANTASWKSNSVGWWYDNGDGTYPRNEWKQIDGVWYYFKSDGYMAANEWVGGYWFGGSGAWTYQAKGGWRSNDKGWWYEDSSGWYPRNTWQKIDGKWYFFKANGYMAVSEWYNGYWFGASGAWTYQPRGSWQQNAVGWWFGDTSGWYAKNETLKINDVLYSFNAAGYWVQ